MKKVILTISLILVVLLISARWSSKAVNAPPTQDLSQTSAGTSRASGLAINEMIDHSDLIAIGNCVETRSVWVDRRLVTLATISVAETLKGAELRTVTVSLPGGIDANRKFPVAMTYPGAPRISPGEDVFLFLTSHGETAGSYSVTGFSQGKLSIVKDELKDNGLRHGSIDRTTVSRLKAQVKAHLRGQ